MRSPKGNKLISILLVLSVLIGMLPLSYNAAEITMVIYFMPENGGYLRLNKNTGVLVGGLNINGPMTIPEKIEGYDVLSIGDSAFKSIGGLTSVTIPEGVTAIGNNAFDGCGSLEEITFGGKEASIGSEAFKDCAKLESIRLPETLTSLGKAAFSGCTALEEIILPASLEVLPEQVFSGCEAISAITLPEGLKIIEMRAFEDCTGIKRITLPGSLEELGAYVFSGCTKLQDLIILNGLPRLGDFSFSGCENLSRIEIPASVISIAGEAFDGLSDFTIYAAAATYAQVFAAANGIPCVFGKIPEEDDPGIITTPFVDIEGHWAEDDIKWAYANNLVNGTEPDIFAPYNKMLRCMFATVLYRLEGEPPTEFIPAFTDVQESYYYGMSVSWANKNGIILGMSETEFMPDLNISRQDFAVMLYRYAEYKDEDTSAASDVSSFGDYAEINAYAQDAMSWAVATQIIRGVPDNNIYPRSPASRAEVCTMLHRYVQYTEK